jgi:UDP-perosamine 4-acetyltransferase
VRVVLVGAGGHARSILEALAGGEIEVVACTDPQPRLHGTDLDGVPVVGGDERLPALLRDGVKGAVIALGATGDNGPRARLYEEVAALGFAMPVVRSPSAIVARNAAVAAGSVLLTGAIVGPGTRLGRNVIVNTGAVVEHDCAIGDHAHVASGAVLGGAVSVGEGAHVGLGATVRQGIAIARKAVVGAGAVVVADVAEGAVVVGVPARPRDPGRLKCGPHGP